MSAQRVLSVYFARAMDGRPDIEITAETERVRAVIEGASFVMIDPYLSVDRLGLEPTSSADAELLVTADLALLRGADVVLMDLSIPGRAYVGCICEMVYSHQEKIPVVAITGDTGLENRFWLRHHCEVIVRTLDEAIAAVESLGIAEAKH